ncbi:MAG: hypothetical protein ACJLUP_03340 [Agrobacterium tumefaciens]
MRPSLGWRGGFLTVEIDAQGRLESLERVLVNRVGLLVRHRVTPRYRLLSGGRIEAAMPLIAMPYPDLTVYLKLRLPPRQTKFLLLQCGH